MFGNRKETVGQRNENVENEGGRVLSQLRCESYSKGKKAAEESCERIAVPKKLICTAALTVHM